MRKSLFFLFLVIAFTTQGQTFKKGMVIDSLQVNDTLNETYALYLPKIFTGNNSLPMIFIFDPEGNGKKAARLFTSAAEEQGYILVSSNDINSEKTLEANLQAATRLVTEATSRIPVDFNNISVVGFSDAAKVASSLPLVFKNIHGVIAVGDQQIPFDYLKEINKFFFIGIVGDEQVNTYGMQVVNQELKRLGFPSEIYTFNGGRQWPNPGILSSAVGSLSLHAIKKELLPSNPQLIETLYQQDLARVERLKSEDNYLKAYELLELFKSKYEGLKSISEIKDKQKQLRRSQVYTAQKKQAFKIKEKEDRLIDDYIFFFHEDIQTANFENLGWWNYQVLQLDQYIQGKNEAEAAMGYRLKSLLNELAKNQCAELGKKEADLEQELFANMLQTVFDQKNYPAYKKVISLSAIDGDFQTSLFYLEEMLKNGYTNLDSLYEIEGTLALKITPDYNLLVDKYLGDAKFHTKTK